MRDDRKKYRADASVFLPSSALSARFGQGTDRNWEILSFALCLFCSITLILNIHPIGDGMWFWYAIEVRSGLRLYRDLKLPLQPLFVLITAAFQMVFGESWLASKIFPLLQACTFTWLLILMSRFAPWRAWQRCSLVVGAFLLNLRLGIARFDDYHVTANCLFLFALWLVARVALRSGVRLSGITATTLGVCCALCTLTRLNDGVALTAAVVLSTWLVCRQQLWRTWALTLGGMLSTFAGVLAALRETPASWLQNSVIAARAIKGGGHTALFAPLLLPWKLANLLANWRTPLLLVVLAVINVWLFRVGRGAARGPQRHLVLLTLASGVGLLWYLRLARTSFALETTTMAVALVLLVSLPPAALIAWTRRTKRNETYWYCAIALLLFPWFHMVGGALTSANANPDLFFSLSMLAVLAAPLFAQRLASSIALPILGNLLLFAITVIPAKIFLPYQWFTYMDLTLYQDRLWYQHPKWGPMYLEKAQYAVLRPMCDQIGHAGGSQQLLALPFPYPNYFCGIAPWKAYVQTWYDTVSASTIRTLVRDLEQPPHWIVYQRDPVAIAAHELTYYRGTPLPHRELDALILRHIREGDWKLRQRTCFHGSEWLLIETDVETDRSNALQVDHGAVRPPEEGECHI